MKFVKNIFTFCIVLTMACQIDRDTALNDCPCNCDQNRAIDGITDIRFLATADPQYNYEDMNPDKETVINSDNIANILTQKICCEAYRGVVISGDLTHYSRLDEFERYQQFIQCIKPYTFDGLGNHDFTFIGNDSVNLQPFLHYGMDKILPGEPFIWKEESLVIWEDIRSRKRIPKVNSSYPNIHYSWDWEDVHFVQLNVFPGDTVMRYKKAIHPFNSITFLKEDLKKHVGDSGRPVILAHHYGMDNFSLGTSNPRYIKEDAQWWSEAQRQAYWEILRPYNVIAIFTGHAHYCETACYLPWDGVSIGEGEVGSDFIPTFTSGAAREGKYLDCLITKDQLIIKRITNGELDFEKVIPIKREIAHN